MRKANGEETHWLFELTAIQFGDAIWIELCIIVGRDMIDWNATIQNPEKEFDMVVLIELFVNDTVMICYDKRGKTGAL